MNVLLPFCDLAQEFLKGPFHDSEVSASLQALSGDVKRAVLISVLPETVIALLIRFFALPLLFSVLQFCNVSK